MALYKCANYDNNNNNNNYYYYYLPSVDMFPREFKIKILHK